MPQIIDISVLVDECLPLWPGSPGYQQEWRCQISPQNPANVSQISLEIHTGTHIDAPLHFVAEGKSVDQLALSVLIGAAFVAYLPGIREIRPQDLEGLELPSKVKRLLLKTDNSLYWKEKTGIFHQDYVALTSEAAQWVVDKGIQLVGIDYLSIQKFEDSPLTHQILLQADVVILETINLSEVNPGWYELICLPIKWKGVEASPVRAILKSI
ncbi:MAG: cyclase family protein [Microscillaceae bacterium]|nr:cyclase family protein [Microscillaceae bacterium]